MPSTREAVLVPGGRAAVARYSQCLSLGCWSVVLSRQRVQWLGSSSTRHQMHQASGFVLHHGQDGFSQRKFQRCEWQKNSCPATGAMWAQLMWHCRRCSESIGCRHPCTCSCKTLRTLWLLLSTTTKLQHSWIFSQRKPARKLKDIVWLSCTGSAIRHGVSSQPTRRYRMARLIFNFALRNRK